MDADPNPLADPESLFHLHMPALLDYAVNELQIPRPEAEQLAANILLASIRQLATIPDIPTWLRGAMDMAVRGTKC